MDASIREHASLVARHSLEVTRDDEIVVAAPPVAEPFVEKLYDAFADLGALPVTITAGEFGIGSDRAIGAFLAANEGTDAAPTHLRRLLEDADGIAYVWASDDGTGLETASLSALTRLRRAYEPLLETTFFEGNTCLTHHPTAASARAAGLEPAEYRALVREAICRDWDRWSDRQAWLVERLETARDVRVLSESGTDLAFSVEGMAAAGDCGEANLPGGEVYTAPVPTSVDGTLSVDTSHYYGDRRIDDVTLTFEDGEVTDHAASRNEEALEALLSTDAGARRVGEFGVGTNDAIDVLTDNVLLDEKVAGTVHLALGRAYEECVPSDRSPNASAVHRDLIVDLRRGGTLEVDGEPLILDGTFVSD